RWSLGRVRGQKRKMLQRRDVLNENRPGRFREREGHDECLWITRQLRKGGLSVAPGNRCLGSGDRRLRTSFAVTACGRGVAGLGIREVPELETREENRASVDHSDADDDKDNDDE